MLATERLLEIQNRLGPRVRRIVPIELDDETLRLILYLENGDNLRVTEQWKGPVLERYSYYWLTAANALEVGWDNAPHHTQLENFPHHKHVGEQSNLYPSYETRLEDVVQVILTGGRATGDRGEKAVEKHDD